MSKSLNMKLGAARGRINSSNRKFKTPTIFHDNVNLGYEGPWLARGSTNSILWGAEREFRDGRNDNFQAMELIHSIKRERIIVFHSSGGDM